MVIIDYLLVAIFFLSAVMGLFRGLIKEAFSLVGWGLAIWCAWRFGAAVAERIPSIADDSAIEIWVARIIVLIVVLILSGLFSKLISMLIHQSGLSGTDRIVGMVFGMARGVLLIGLVILMLEAVGFNADPWWQESKLIPYATPLADRLGDLAGEGMDLIGGQVDGLPVP
jgi:membrane protein required for colicin V production